MKKKLSKAAWEALSADLKAVYKLVGDEYVLTVEGEDSDDVGALRRANDRLKAEKDEAERKRVEAQNKLDDITNKDARKAGDIEALEASWRTKVKETEDAGNTKVTKLTAHLNKLAVENVARQMATEISTDPDLILPHILPRLKVDLDGEIPITRVLDAEGKPSASSLKELQQEFVDNKKFSSILIGSRASGGADGRRMGGSGNGGAGTLTVEQFIALDEKKRTELFKSDPETFKSLVEQQKAAIRKF